MTTLKWIGLAAAGLLTLLNVPLVSSAVSSNGGTVQVYLILTDQGATHRQLSDFSISVSGSNTPGVTFPGTHSGEVVLVGSGTFAVTATSPQGTVVSYSAGCSGTMQQFEAATCVISDSPSLTGSTATTPYNCSQYGGGYNCAMSYLSLACTPGTQTVGIGQTASFTATGGSGVYSWATPDRNYIGIGSKLNTALSTVGNQVVIVSSNGQTATCSVNVTATQQTPGTTISSTYIPKLPNTGFAPTDSLSIVLSLVMLIGFGIAFAPYVRQAFASALR